MIKKKGKYIILGLMCLLLVITIPIGVNSLMGLQMGVAYGNTPTWIAFFGSYLGAVVSGIITILGVFLTIRFTQRQNKLTLQHNIQENRRQKLPEMINNLGECLDFLGEVKEELEFTSRGSFKEVLDTDDSEKKLKLHYVNSGYHVAKKPNLMKFTKGYYKTIRNHTVKVDASAYEAFLQFCVSMDFAYKANMYDIESEFISFQMGMMNDYMETDMEILIGDDTKLTDIKLMEDDKFRLILMKRKLYRAEAKYLLDIIEAYDILSQTLEWHLVDLASDFSK